MARLLAIFPGWLTGRIGPRARQEVRTWTKNNATLRTLQYGRFRRFLIWSTDHPVVFATLSGLAAAGIAYLTAMQGWAAPWNLHPPKLKADFDIAAYTGVPWGVQATLVALVYPIVLSFIALLLQRKAHSTVALRVYVLDSAVVPAGASSIGLLVAMGVQYFATPYSTPEFLEEYMAPLLALDGAWLLINLLLTGFFLSRTIRFIQEEEQRHAFTRIAVDVALRSELTSSVKQHIFVSAAQSDWRFPEISADDELAPQVHMFALRSGSPEVKRDLKGSLVLHDVHLRLLHLVAVSWRRRAVKWASAAKGKAPTLFFPPRVGAAVSGETILCTIEDGPPLRRLERLLVRAAFAYRPARRGTLSLSSRKMLEEIGGEVEAAAEQQRFGAAEERLRDVLRLHKTLLQASAADAESVSGNAATIGTSPYSWGDSSFDMEWLRPYRDIGRIAVNRLDEDGRLFRTLAAVPASIARDLPSRPQKLLIDAQLVGTNLAYQLAGWWTRKADASLAPGATFSGRLPAPLDQAYEQAVIAFIGSWGGFRVEVPKAGKLNDSQMWEAITGRAVVYAKHIESSAQLFMKAVSRGDDTGSVWLLDSLLKWWGNRKYELKCAGVEKEFRVRHVTMTLADKNWAAAQEFLWDGSEPVTIVFAEMALSLAICRYWESMRLFMVLLLIQNAGSKPTAESRELRYAAALIQGAALRDGGTVDARPLATIDAVLRSVLENVFGIETVVRRIDEFAERLHQDRDAPVVSGWIYSWSGTPMDFESMKRAQGVLLVSLASTRRNIVLYGKKLIQRWWKDVDKLEQVQKFCVDLREDIRSESFSDMQATVSCLIGLLAKSHRPRFGRLAVVAALRQLEAVSQTERRITLRALAVDAKKVRGLSDRIAAHALDRTKISPPIGALNFMPGLSMPTMKESFRDAKKRYVENIDLGSDTGLAELMGERVRAVLIARSFEKVVRDAGLRPVNEPSLRDEYDASHADMQAYLLAIASQCSALKSSGAEPVVVVGRSEAAALLHEYRWGNEHWRCPLPMGVIVTTGNVNLGNSIALINGVPVYELETPHGDCFVLPAVMLRTLALAGSGTDSALSIDWHPDGDDRLIFDLSWQGGFLPGAD
ncbi:hypothetical protein [Variovorax sp. CCNWLW235]|uniref:hypothetical protein n=1 Tax=Variovorax sp. CCNWLW235 TaxID=3127463 RepID=UPI0030780ECA